MKWYNYTDDAILEAMKYNTISHRMLWQESPVLANAFEMVPDSDLLYLAEGGWMPTCGCLSPEVHSEFTYRILLEPGYDVGDVVNAECRMEILSKMIRLDGTARYILQPCEERQTRYGYEIGRKT